jgi:hypothetical protein
MADGAEECWRKAKQCAAIARAATDPDVQRIYNELVRQRREMAERVEQMERRLKARSAAADIEGSPGAASGGTQQSRAGAPGRCIPRITPPSPCHDKSVPVSGASEAIRKRTGGHG